MTKVLDIDNINSIYHKIKNLVISSKKRVYQNINHEMVLLYWNIGKIIINIQDGKKHAKYDDKTLEKLSVKLTEEFGKGFMYVGSQVRITLEEEHFYPDLVFYNRILKYFVIIDLKIGTITHKDLGQISMYVNYYDRKIKSYDENKTIGILLCANKNETVVKYSLPFDNDQIYASKYKLNFPSDEDFIYEIEKEKHNYYIYK